MIPTSSNQGIEAQLKVFENLRLACQIVGIPGPETARVESVRDCWLVQADKVVSIVPVASGGRPFVS